MLISHSTSKYQTGAGFIEVLTSLLILSIGILGVINLQSRTLQFNQGSLFESRASVLAADIIDRMRANPSQVAKYVIDMTDSDPGYKDCYGSSADCSTQDFANYDVATWRENVAAVLPSGSGQVQEEASPTGSPVFIVTIQYSDSRVEDASAFGQSNAAAPKQFVFRTSI